MIYVVSDLHGCPLESLKKLLEKVDFSDNDFCFILGDVIDRGPNGIDILKWLLAQPNIQLILGNHEEMLLSCSFLFEAITEESIGKLSDEKLELLAHWNSNGARPTLDALFETDREIINDILDYLNDATLYETLTVNGQEFILTHSGLGMFQKDKEMWEYSVADLLWNRPKMADEYYDGAITVFGHTPTFVYGEEYRGRIIKTDTWINIDVGAGYGQAPAILRLDDLREFYLRD